MEATTNPPLVTATQQAPSRPREWDEIVTKMAQPPPQLHAPPRSPQGKNRNKGKTQVSAPVAVASAIDPLWALDLLEPLALPNPLIQKEEAATVLHGLCFLRQVFSLIFDSQFFWNLIISFLIDFYIKKFIL